MNAPLPVPLTIAEHNGSVVLTLNRPDARNPLSEATLQVLTEALDRIAQDRSVRAVILASTGPVFCEIGRAHV